MRQLFNQGPMGIIKTVKFFLAPSLKVPPRESVELLQIQSKGRNCVHDVAESSSVSGCAVFGALESGVIWPCFQCVDPSVISFRGCFSGVPIDGGEVSSSSSAFDDGIKLAMVFSISSIAPRR